MGPQERPGTAHDDGVHPGERQGVPPVGFGPQSDWFRNLQDNPRATIQMGGSPRSVRAVRVTDPAELLTLLEASRRREPALINTYLASLGIPDTPKDILAHRKLIYFVRFDPISEPTPAPLKADLVWVWPALVAAAAGVFWLARRRKK